MADGNMPGPSDPPIQALFTPLRIGNVLLQHRIVMAPLTRYRADNDHCPTSMMIEYYAQRASMPGTLLITEGTIIAPRAGGCDNAPGIWNESQIEAWKKVVNAVHERSSFIYLQLWALGRSASPAILAREASAANLPESSYPFVSASNIPIKNRDGTLPEIHPRPLTEEEIDEYVEDYTRAARNAVEGAGFDGVEVNCANGYLLDQFLQDVSNTRTDLYGGSIPARCLFPLRVLSSIVSAVGPARAAIRISPWNAYLSMRMSDPIPTFSYLISETRRRHPNLAYLHVVEGSGSEESNNFARTIWRGERDTEEGEAVFLSASGHDRASALRHAEEGDVVVFGKWFISNPDLPRRIKENIAFNPYNFPTFYKKMSAEGYIDYAFAPE